MARSTKAAWLEGPSDLRTATVEDVPVEGEDVLVRGLPAAFSSEAQSEALELMQKGREQVAKVNTAKLEAIQFAHGVIEPQFSLEEAVKISERYGPAFRKVIDKIDELSAINKEAIAEAEARFPAGGESEGGGDLGNGTGARDDGSDLPARTGARVGDAG
jgi:hypothetical protein